MCEQSSFQRLITVHGDRKSHRAAELAVDVMASMHPQQIPSVPLDDRGELLARKLFHTMISITRSFPVAFGAMTSTERQPSTAS